MQIVESQIIDNLLPANQDDREVEDMLAKKEERIQARKNERKRFRVTLPIVPLTPQQAVVSSKSASGSQNSEELASLVAKGQAIALQSTVGMSLRQVYSGKRLSELALDVDTLRFQSFVDELQGRTVLEDDDVGSLNTENDESVGSIQVLQNSLLEGFRESFDGVLVSSVVRGGLAWEAGIRAGDVLAGTSATIGNKLWPKSTLDGVRSAISSRKVLSSNMEFEFRRLGANGGIESLDGVQSFELKLSRPIGINIEGKYFILMLLDQYLGSKGTHIIFCFRH